VHPHASPLRAATLAGLPHALVVTAQYDPLRDEGELYAEALRTVGVSVEMKRWDGMNHGFFFFPGIVDKATQAVDEACAWARRVFGN
jgi:acetyl esterase